MKITSAAFAGSGALFLLYPALRPSVDSPESLASAGWVYGHFAAMIGFILIALATLGLHQTLDNRLSLKATALTWAGAGLTLPYYGAEDFGLNIIAKRYPDTAMQLAEEFRFGPLAVSMFAAGLLLLATGMILVAVAVWRSGILARWSAMPLAVGFALFIPQFFGPYPLRIAHGALIAIGGILLAIELWRKSA